MHKTVLDGTNQGRPMPRSGQSQVVHDDDESEGSKVIHKTISFFKFFTVVIIFRELESTNDHIGLIGIPKVKIKLNTY